MPNYSDTATNFEQKKFRLGREYFPRNTLLPSQGNNISFAVKTEYNFGFAARLKFEKLVVLARYSLNPHISSICSTSTMAPIGALVITNTVLFLTHLDNNQY